MPRNPRLTAEERLAKERARSRAYDAAHREERRAKATARRKLFGPILNARTQKWREEHPEKALASNQKTREKRRMQARAYRHTYYWTHRETILAELRAQAGTPKRLAKKRAYREANLDKIRAQERVRYAKNPDNNIAGVKYRNALKRGAAGGDYSAAQWREQQEVQDHRCYYCGKRRKGQLTQDHIVPLSKGGLHTASNIIAACRSCNSGKRDKAPPISVQMTLLTVAKPFKKKKRS